ncbi:MAG: glycyl-radical enzyme activating protein [Deltaproteobacteria bacterium]|nr:glycyl-radical enzyme activating protein [Deltaproteobacteria bacterium]
MTKNPLILDIKGNSLDDGPGIRTVIFFKGCPLDCVWCQNPESKRTVAEIAFDAKECIGCGRCLEVCPEGALSRENPFYIDRDACTLCFTCVEECPARALDRVGREMTVEDIVKAVVRDRPFFNTSGGGVTLSGGEPTLFPDFVSSLLQALKGERIHTIIETCGQFRPDTFESLMLPYLDAVYFDIKLMDARLHREYCGVSNETIVENFVRLKLLCAGRKVVLLPRVPLITGITERESNLAAIALFLKEQGAPRVQLLPYNPLWHDKTDKIGAANSLRQNAAMTTWLDKKRIEACREIFTRQGIEVV